MVSVQGTFNNGVVHPTEPIAAREGQQVIITFVEPENSSEQEIDGSDWEELNQILEDCQADTGIEDLAHQHDHYLHGTPKREAYP